MTVVFKSEIKLFCLFGHLRVSPINRSEIDCRLSAMYVMFEIIVTDEGGLFSFLNLSALVKSVSRAQCYCMSLCFLKAMGENRPPLPMKLTSKSVVAVVWQSGDSCNARDCSLNSWDWLDWSFTRKASNSLTSPVYLAILGLDRFPPPPPPPNEIHWTPSNEALSYSHPHLKHTELICVLSLISHAPLISLVMADNF